LLFSRRFRRFEDLGAELVDQLDLAGQQAPATILTGVPFNGDPVFIPGQPFPTVLDHEGLQGRSGTGTSIEAISGQAEFSGIIFRV
jgi:hypothetical protein